MSLAGFFAGVGDAAKAQNDADDKDEKHRRDTFGEDLRRVMESEDWPEPARITAAQMRYQLFSNRKLKPKDYEKMWSQVHQASGRESAPGPELAAARSNVPALASLQKKMEPSTGVPAPGPMGPTAPAQPEAGMALLRPAEAAPSFGGQPVPRGVLGIQRPPKPSQTEGLMAPRPFATAVRDHQSAAQSVIDTTPPPPMVYGPRTRAERNVEAMAMWREQKAAEQGFALDTHAKQKAIDAQYTPKKPALEWDSKRGIFVNPMTGTFTVPEGLPEDGSATGDGSPEQQFIATALQAAQAQGVNTKDPIQRLHLLRKLREQWTEAGRDDDADMWKAANFAAQQDFRAYRRDMDLRTFAQQFDNRYTKAKSDFVSQIRSAEMLRAAIEQESLGGDLAAIFSAMRALDPNSVVREQEYKTAQSLGGPWHTMMGKLNQLRGKGIVDDTVRDEFLKLADLLQTTAIKDLTSLNDTYMSMAEGSEIPFEMVSFSGPSTYQRGSTQGQLNNRAGIVLPQANGAWFRPAYNANVAGPPAPTAAPGGMIQNLFTFLNKK